MRRRQTLGKFYRDHPVPCTLVVAAAFACWLSAGIIRADDLAPLSLAACLATPNPLRRALPLGEEHDRLWALLGTVVAGLWYSYAFSAAV